MPNNKHLTFDDRSFIHSSLNIGSSFRCIASHLDKAPSTVSKEIRKHRLKLSTGAYGRIHNKCIHRFSCTLYGLCDDSHCHKSFCRQCKKCNMMCRDFKEDKCVHLSKPPYVCNCCENLRKCNLDKYIYKAKEADEIYRKGLSDHRSGISYTEDELQYMDELISPLVKRKQSIHHICVTNANDILCSERTIYKLIGQGVLSVRNIDLPRKVRYRPRKQIKSFKVDKGCRIGRSYQDLQGYLQNHPDTSIVQMDTVVGRKGGKVFLTIFFTQSDLLLLFIRDHNTSQSVIDVFNYLDDLLGRELFVKLFPVILGDNGSEFSNPSSIECDASGQLRTKVFYCDPSSPHQKPEIERSHEYIRMVIAKGKSFDHLSQSDVNILTSHINSLIRKKLNDMSPMTTFSFFFGEAILHKLDLYTIEPNNVTLSPYLFSSSKEVMPNG